MSNISKDRMRLIIKNPFFATILLKHKLVEKKGHGTVSIDGVSITYDPDFYNDLPQREREAVLCHEALHVSNLHHLRKNGRDHKMWNVACDYAINQFVVDEKGNSILPENCLLDDKYAGMCAERIYSELQKDQKSDNESITPPDQDEEQDDEESPSSSGNNSEDDQDDDNSSKDSPSPIDELYEKCIGEVSDHPNPDGIDESELESETKIMVQQAIQIAKSKGKLPQGLEEAFKELLKPVVDWRSLLSRWIEGFCNTDYSFSHPNPIHLRRKIVLPTMKSDAFANINIAIDTSGSMSDKELQQAVSEVFAGLSVYMENDQEIELKVIYCDSVVQKIDTIQYEGQVTSPKGRGGTLFTPVFECIKDDPPAGLVYVTDGYGYDFPKDPCSEVVWLITDNGDRHFSPPYGDVIHMT